jgi:hypothetical protein
MPWRELAKMNFQQFEAFMQLHGARSWKFKETIGDSVVDI